MVQHMTEKISAFLRHFARTFTREDDHCESKEDG